MVLQVDYFADQPTTAISSYNISPLCGYHYCAWSQEDSHRVGQLGKFSPRQRQGQLVMKAPRWIPSAPRRLQVQVNTQPFHCRYGNCCCEIGGAGPSGLLLPAGIRGSAIPPATSGMPMERRWYDAGIFRQTSVYASFPRHPLWTDSY
jgi:hypothetical protein